MIAQLYFAMAIRESARHLSGNKDYSSAGEEKESMLDSRDGSSLAIDRLRDQAGGQNTAAGCFLL